MSNARKLQTEIDRVMKKVDEGVELFDEIWEKVYAAEQQNQKEKYEMDLKKEIKKLQRQRDQIKTWIGSSDVKDKEPLLEARKLIESKMEQFKICEKQTKTKAYSKEGLLQQERLDPAEEAKLATTTWLGEYSEKITGMVEEIDFEIEKLSSGKGKKTNKHQIEELQERIANHRFHISKLEGIIRLVNNDRLDVEAVDQMKDDLDYYLESYEDEDYMAAYDEEYIYESLGLDELDVVNVDRVTQAPLTTKKASEEASAAAAKGKEKKSSRKTAVSSSITLKIGRAITSKEKKKEEEERATPSKAIKSSSSSSTKSIEVPPPVKPAASAPPAGASMAAILKRESEQQEKERQKREQQARAQAEQQRQQQAREQQEAQLRQQEVLRQQQQQQQEALKRQQAEAIRLQAQQEAAKQQQAAQLQAEKVQQSQQNSQGGNSLDTLTTGLGGLGLGSDDRSQAGSVSLAGSTQASQNPPTIENGGSNLVTAMNESLSLAPNTGEKDRSRSYAPQNPYPTPSSYPATPSAIFENPAVFEKLGTDCLFFIFYYAQGTYQQYLAARELKKQSWRFHKKYMTWFQRHEEPKITTDEYEQGTYVYFDYETGWCTRIKTDFRFEYSFLEDSLQ